MPALAQKQFSPPRDPHFGAAIWVGRLIYENERPQIALYWQLLTGRCRGTLTYNRDIGNLFLEVLERLTRRKRRRIYISF
jgi:hypothetical protein